jgi:predicted outer membrane lipoprotein
MNKALKYTSWTLGVLLSIAALLGVLQYVASERVEVVELHTVDEAGETVTTRLWVVDDEGFQYLRVGASGSGWFSRIQSNGEFEVTRNGMTERYRAEVRPQKSDRINDLMQEKYSWGNTLIGALTGSRENSQPIELHRL